MLHSPQDHRSWVGPYWQIAIDPMEHPPAALRQTFMKLIRRLPLETSAGVTARALAFVLLLLVSCGEPANDNLFTGGVSPSPTSYEGTWELVEGRAPEGPIEISRRWRITLTIDGDRWGGLSACNHYGASATVTGRSISIGGVGGTAMGCHPDVAETEARYHSALQAVDTIERSDETLTLNGAKAQLIYRFVPPPPTAELTDVRWELQSLIHGYGPDATASDVHPAHLYFDSDGTFDGSTGCRGLEGEWIEEGDRVTFTYIGADEGKCSDALAEQNDAIINLGDGFTFDIEGETLTIYGRFSDTGLQYRAGSD